MKRMILLSPAKAEVLEKIGQCSIAHFACHGEMDSDPSKSRILFSDWEIESFSVVDMAQRKLDKAELAYISACHVANNRNLQLLDESIHMTGAFQLAGFATVIGTLWGIEDEHSAEVAKWVHHAMLTGEGKLDCQNAARGLHFAIRKLRELFLKESRSKTLRWGPYIHVGV
jgi:CHAT domain